jgi:VIT1/CCC1 family predicted Fe2+/Mn2+ transporter
MTNSPNRKDRTRPLELLGLAAGFGVFVGLISLMASREPVLALIALAVTFILAIVVLATLNLTVSVSDDERSDLDEQDRGAGH